MTKTRKVIKYLDKPLFFVTALLFLFGGSMPYYPTYGYGYYGQSNSNYAIILVLFILLVIVIGARYTR